jgi:hypothetical protein
MARLHRHVSRTSTTLRLSLKKTAKGSWHGWEISLDGPIKDAGVYQNAKERLHSRSC